MTTHVWLYNADTDAVWHSPADYAPIAKARGWVDTDPPTDEYGDLPEAPPADEPPEEVQTGFDPAEHTVAEVQAHIEEHQDSAPGEVERVLEAERGGKNRKTITGD